MGQAKQKKEALRKSMLARGALWDFPATAWEAETVKILMEKPVQRVQRAPKDQLRAMNLQTNDCHGICRWYEKNDPTRESKQVAGWWVEGSTFVLHSVIHTQGRLVCITPSALNETFIEFIPDPEISWKETGEVYTAVRDGHEITVGLRIFPDAVMQQNSVIRLRLEAGMDPYKAIQFSDAEIEKLKSEAKSKHGVI